MIATPSGTECSNPICSSGESANFRWALNKTRIAQSCVEGGDWGSRIECAPFGHALGCGRDAAEPADHRHRLLLRADGSRTQHAGRQQCQQLAASHPSTASASQGSRSFSVGGRIRPSLARFFEDLTAREQHSAGRLAPQPFVNRLGMRLGALKANGGVAVMRRRGPGPAAGVSPAMCRGPVASTDLGPSTLLSASSQRQLTQDGEPGSPGVTALGR